MLEALLVSVWSSLKIAKCSIPVNFIKNGTDLTARRRYSVDANQYAKWPSGVHKRPLRPESVLRSVVEKKSKQLSSAVKSNGATAETLQRSHCVYSEMLHQLQEWLQAEIGGEGPRSLHAIIDSTAQSIAERHVRRTVAPIVAKKWLASTSSANSPTGLPRPTNPPLGSA